MSEHGLDLDREAIDLLLTVIETPDATIAGEVLDGFYAAAAPALKRIGLLKASGHHPVTTSLADHDDEPVNLSWSPEHRAYGYFSQFAGWVSVPGDQLALFGIDFDELFRRLLSRLDASPQASSVALVPDLLWEVGDVRLPGRSKRVPLWIGRRLADSAVWTRFVDAVRHRPAPGLRIVLSLTPANRLSTHAHLGHSIISVRDVADHSGLAVDPNLLVARIASSSQQGFEPITIAADGASVSVRGKRYAFSGSKQRDVIRQLYEAWKSGRPECLTAEVLETAGYSASVNTLAKAFSKRGDWRDFITEEHGRCWMFA